MYEIVFSSKAERQLAKLEKEDQKRIIAVLERVRIRPIDFLQKLVGSNAYKIRVGDLRIIVGLDPEKQSIRIVLISNRKNIYDRLEF